MIERNDKVYILLDKLEELEEVLVYDFSLEENDKISLPSFLVITAELSSVEMKVIKKEMVTLYGQERKKLTLKLLEHPNNPNEVWIEGIGSLNGPFYSGIQAAADVSSALASVKEGEEAIYCNPNPSSTYCGGVIHDCEGLTTSIAIQESPNSELKLEITPNIFQNNTQLKFHLPQAQTVNLSIYNHQGQLLKRIYNNQVVETGNHEKQLNLTDAPNGMYYAVLSLNGTAVSTQKMILMK